MTLKELVQIEKVSEKIFFTKLLGIKQFKEMNEYSMK